MLAGEKGLRTKPNQTVKVSDTRGQAPEVSRVPLAGSLLPSLTDSRLEFYCVQVGSIPFVMQIRFFLFCFIFNGENLSHPFTIKNYELSTKTVKRNKRLLFALYILLMTKR